jgi:putative transposase
VAAAHRQVRRRRADLIHRFTHRATAKAAVICVEDLNVAGMVLNRHLALSVSDAGMGEALRQLAYKAKWRGRHLVRIDRWAPSSKTCSGCGHRQDDLALSDRAWARPACGTAHDRDANAARNVLRWGLEELIRRGTPECAPGESGAPAAGPTRKGKGPRRNSARRTGTVDPPNPVGLGEPGR